jgi:hypothetical protein
MIESGLIFLCMADNIFAARRAFAYLVDIRNLFLSEVCAASDCENACNVISFSLFLFLFYSFIHCCCFRFCYIRSVLTGSMPGDGNMQWRMRWIASVKSSNNALYAFLVSFFQM